MSHSPSLFDRIKLLDEEVTIVDTLLADNSRSFEDKAALVELKTLAGDGSSVLYSSLRENTKLAFDEVKLQEVQMYLKSLYDVGETVEFMNAHLQMGSSFGDACIAEVFSKVLSYLDAEVLQGQTLKSVPVFDGNGNVVGSEDYAIHRDTLGNEEVQSRLPYLLLEPTDSASTHPWWFVIRGTDPNVFGRGTNKVQRESAVESLKADFVQKSGIDNTALDNKWNGGLRARIQAARVPVKVAGHSLGGALAMRAAVLIETHEDTAGKLDAVFSFNGPGVSLETKNLFANVVHTSQLKFISYDKTGDIVPGAGKCLIGTHIRVLTKSPMFTPVDVLHREVDLNKSHYIQRVDVVAEENKSSRKFFEGTRKHLGKSIVGAVVNSLNIWNKSQTFFSSSSKSQSATSNNVPADLHKKSDDLHAKNEDVIAKNEDLQKEML
jgi:hypothetical protein